MKLVASYCLFFCFFINKIQAQIPGCTDPLATNYNTSATANDGTCLYAATSITPTASNTLSDTLVETSGLTIWNDQIWTHNDNSDQNIYALDTNKGKIISVYPLSGVSNIDWEEIAQDSNYLYIGNFGNNVNGNRKDLHILRIEKKSLLAFSPKIDSLFFSYSDQTDFTATGANNTDFDCEAFIVSRDSIYLFTKQWKSEQTNIYALPKTPGTHTAQLLSGYNIAGLITGASYLEDEKLIALCGYSSLLQPFVYLLYDFKKGDFWSGNKRKLNLSLSFHQIEGITSSNGLNYYLSNEYFSKSPITTLQKLHHFDLTTYLDNYLKKKLSLASRFEKTNNISFHPNPAKDELYIDCKIPPQSYKIYNAMGQNVANGTLSEKQSRISLSSLSAGLYFLDFNLGKEAVCQFEKQ